MTRSVHSSARRHGVQDEDALRAAADTLYTAFLDEDSPARQLCLGFDTQGRILELVVLCFDSGNELIIHAMPARRQYLQLLRAP